MMKLRNKKTGEIKDACEVLDMKQEDCVLYKYYSLAELNEDWEDAPEEPKVCWCIDNCGGIIQGYDIGGPMSKARKAIGNYFETEEEAEKAVEKLKAWKRLKDKGFRFRDWNIASDGKGITIFANYPSETRADLDLLFGGEE